MDSPQPSEHQLTELKRYRACSKTVQSGCLYILLYTTKYIYTTAENQS